MLNWSVLIVAPLHLLLALALVQPSKEIAELKALRAEYIKATNEYKASLAKLLSYQEERAGRAEDKLEHSRKLRAEGLISRGQLEDAERELTEAKRDVAKTQSDIANADEQVAALPSDEELIKEYRRARLTRKRSTKPCANWDLVARQRQTANSISFSYRIVCR